MVAGNKTSGLTLTDIDAHRTSEERQLDGKSGKKLYQISYLKNEETTTTQGKVTELKPLTEASQPELQKLSKEGYTHYGIFRLKDRSTTVIVQDDNGNTYKTFTLGRNSVKISHPVRVTEHQ
jgi:hypothetical protein